MQSALTDSELERLAKRLSQSRNPDALSLEAVDGLFCALIASPAMVMPSQYIPVILGADPKQTAAFADLKDVNDTLSLLMRYWNSIAEDFRSGDQLHLPVRWRDQDERRDAVFSDEDCEHTGVVGIEGDAGYFAVVVEMFIGTCGSNEDAVCALRFAEEGDQFTVGRTRERGIARNPGYDRAVSIRQEPACL